MNPDPFIVIGSVSTLGFMLAGVLIGLSKWLDRWKRKQAKMIVGDPNIRSVSFAPAPRPERPRELAFIDRAIPMQCMRCHLVQLVAENLEDIALCDSCGRNSALIQIGPRQNVTIVVFRPE